MWWVKLLLCLLPVNQPPTEFVDLMELNHNYDFDGRRNWDQVIYYDWCPKTERYQVRAFTVITVQDDSRRPMRVEPSGYVFWTKVGWVPHRVVSTHYRETWSQDDPEIIEREYLPQEQRRPLRAAP